MKKYIYAMLAVALTIGIFAFGRGNSADDKKPDFTHEFRFNGTQLNQARVVNQYELLDEDNVPVCSGNQLPCIIQVESDNPSPSAALSTYLSSAGSDEAVRNAAISKKN